jgi:ABC-type multidrug transport system ATPase subunit/pSer/pThr/pTyr-binding forkhead associated (FHA) protein
MPVCYYCGVANPESGHSCLNCGRPLGRTEERAAPSPPAAVGGRGPGELAHFLVAESGASAGRQFLITAAGLRVGRQPDQNQVVLDDPEVSRRHARLYLDEASKVRLEDSSSNGTYVNGRRAEQGVLQPGEQIRFGLNPSCTFTYRAEASEAMAVARQLAAAVAGGGAAGRPADTVHVRPDEAAAPNARLQLVLDAYAVEDLPLQGPRTELGRQPGANRIAIEHPTVSDAHAEVVQTGEGTNVLRDLHSAHGTYVNGERVSEKPLREGDLIRLGECDTRLLLYREAHRRALVLRDIELVKPVVTIGRDISNQVHINHPTVSMFHAQVHKQGNVFELMDRNSTNGTYVNGTRITRQRLQPRDRITLGAIQFVFDGSTMEQQSDGAGVRLTALELHRTIQNPQTGRPLVLLDGISLAIEPREFVGLLGPAGAGKSTLMYALNGAQPADHGRVLFNNSDLYREHAALRAAMGYLPQEDILHRTLTVRQCLYFGARLRLPDDYGEKEILARVEEVLRSLDLSERADVPITQLSGGQRKRVSLGLELLSKPSLLFMDEPTAGQDPRTEMRLMQLFREIANRQATIVCTTHLLGSFSLLDKVAVVVQGRLAYFGPSQEMLTYFKTARPTEVYDRLQEKPPEAWAKQYRESELYRESMGGSATDETIKTSRRRVAPPPAARRQSPARQLATLVQRQLALRVRGWGSVFGLLAPPAVIALLVGLMKRGPNEPKTLFMIMFSALWFGCSAAVREIVDEQAMYRRERERGLAIPSYLGSKLVYLLGLAVAQSALFLSVLTLMGAQENHFPEAMGLMALMTVEGALIGLLISALCKTPEKALSVFPLALIPQLLLAGLFVPAGDLDPFFPVHNKEQRRIEYQKLPKDLVPPAMSPVLRYGISPLMVARWGLEALADLYIHDNTGGSVVLLNSLAITFHPGDVAEARAYLDSVNDQLQGKIPVARPPETQPALPQYLVVLGGFAVGMVAATGAALKLKDLRGRR